MTHASATIDIDGIEIVVEIIAEVFPPDRMCSYYEPDWYQAPDVRVVRDPQTGKSVNFYDLSEAAQETIYRALEDVR